MTKLRSIGAALLASSFICSIAFANCQAVVQNNSAQPWIVKFESARGNVYFPGTSCDKNGPCVVPAHGYLNLEYTYTTGFATGVLDLKDYRGEQRALAYFSNSPVSCPNIRKLALSSSVSINDPSKGSFVLLNDVW